jgi:hypothetical protein
MFWKGIRTPDLVKSFLSCMQVRKLLIKFVSRDQINYRKLTDRPVSKAGSDAVWTAKMTDVDDRRLAQGAIW